MAVRRCAHCAQHSGLIMRTLVAVNIIAGICLIAFGATVEFPIDSFPPIAMILIGVLSLGSAIAGIAGSYHRSCCLSCFLVLHGLNVLAQFGLLIGLWVNVDGVQAAIAPEGHGGKFDADHVHRILLAARWLMLLFLAAETTSLGLAIALRWWIKPDGKDIYNNFDEANLQDRALSMAQLRTDIEGGTTRYSSTNNSVYDKVRGKMASKYGQFSHGVTWNKKWWPWG